MKIEYDRNRSILTPPTIVFNIVWPILYILSFIGFILFWRSHKQRLLGTLLFIIQFILNISWIIVFFKLNNITASVIIIIWLWISLLTLMTVYFKVNVVASLLFLPYIAWVTFAIYLNIVLQRRRTIHEK
jgi:tryptophan-rich sensory protein